ncbi:MAG: DsbC family protein [Nitrospirota bacterium]
MKIVHHVFALLVFTAAATPALAGEDIPAVVRQALPQVDIQRVETSELASPLYTVVTAQGIFYLDGSGRYLFTGELYDLKTQENLTQATISARRRIAFNDLPLGDAILYKKGLRRLAIFVDPDCPYCRKLHQELGQLDATVYVFLYPLAELHPLAYRKSVSIWCSENRIAALDAALGGQVVPARDCEHPIDRTVTLGTRLGVRATPTIVLDDGRWIEGYRSAAELARLVGATPSGVPNTNR